MKVLAREADSGYAWRGGFNGEAAWVSPPTFFQIPRTAVRG